MTALAHPELATDQRFKTRDARIKNFSELTRVLGEIVARKPRAEWMTLLEANDVPFAPVHNIPDVIDDPQVKHLETFHTLHHPTEGEITAIHQPVRIDGDRDGSDLAAPTLGQHTDEVLRELGYAQVDVESLRKAKAI